MSIHACKQLYATLTLEAVSGSVWAGEVAVTGWRLKNSGLTVDPVSAGDVPLDTFHAEDAAVTRSISGFNITQGWAGVGTDTDHEVTDGDKDGIANAIKTYFSSVLAYVPDDYQVRDIRIYPILGSGATLPEKPYHTATAPDIYTPTSPIVGAVSGQWMSPACALVLSTQTATRGPRGRGRWYLGPVYGMNDNTGLVNSGYAGSVAAAGATMLSTIRGIGGTSSARYAPVVWHRGTDRGSVISSVRVGDEIDFQQRRRRHRHEVYVSSAVT